MNCWNGLDRFAGRGRRVTASIGNYDGVHLGHRAILDAVVGDARRRDTLSLLISFEPHPLAVVAPERRPRLLQTRRQKLDCLERSGLSDLLLIGFTAELAELDGARFVDRLLEGGVNFAAVHVGDNFRFGKGRQGTVETLRAIGDERGFEVFGIPPVEVDGRTVSSSAIRALVEEGAVDAAARMIGRPFALTGEVVRGEGRGRSMDFPTANLAVENEMIPSNGVYVTESVVLASRRPSVTNIGVRPTFGGRVVSVESHLLHFNDDLYQQRMELRFLARLRDEMSFPSAVELADQVARDRAAAEAYFSNVSFQST